MLPIFTAIALGAAGAFMLDPQQGRRRRALLRDKVLRNMREAREFGDAAAKDLRARGEGLSRQMRAQTRALRGGAVGDDVLVARVRAKLGRYVSHPHAIRVTAQDGFVTLDGDVLAAEHGRLLRATHDVSGVRDMADRLDVHASAEGVSALQGGIAPPGERSALRQARWSPGTRALAGGAGAILVTYALLRGGLRGVLAIAGGAALMARAKANRPLLERGVVDRKTEGYPAIGR
jgi:hypothetical protein